MLSRKLRIQWFPVVMMKSRLVLLILGIIDLQYMYLYFVITNQFTYVVIHKRVKFYSEKYANKYNYVKHYMHEVIEPRYVFLFLK